jgi:hypothetical protein
MAKKPTPTPKLKKSTGRYPGPGYDETGPGVPKKVLKKPTGEFPKSNSSLARFIAGVKSNNLTPAQARTAAGLYRDMEKAAGKKGFSGFGSLDKSGAALGKAVKQTQKMTKTKKK